MDPVQSEVAAVAAINDKTRTQHPSSPTSMDSIIAAAAYGNDENQSLDAQAQKALECPCVAELRNGACGVHFTEAFLCFLKSTAEEKGSDCVHPFVALQTCIKGRSSCVGSNSSLLNTETMSIFGSSSSAISPDYFGDEFGLPLPRCLMVKNKATTIQPKSIGLGNPGVTKAVLNELKNGFIKCMQMADSRESRRGEPALAPIMDGLLCLETFVISNLK
ncbi:mitochondrial intermembrane space import and assembly protein 40-like isoform X2 [Durio zibethinus]|uniref:Mitochondrial intermembrane space import and assembly protein 40 homolog n=1 Tax=Durio zibethinus TaxID=66656 RepID=A0A6P5XFZ6_DURZI|nr:mitochondrial intermembrane space import and assembly protein 40-like isoform X2 [Durio zibethinus]